jgi:molybdopterin-guanine dinucleotide biosynthesis protein A
MLLRVLASAEKPTAVRSSGRVHPLIAYYPAAALGHLETAVRDGASATHAVEALHPDLVEAIERETFNVNTPEELKRAEDLLKQPRA